LALDQGDVGNPGSDRVDLSSGDLGVGCLAPAKAHLDLDFVTFFQESPSGAHADLQIVLVSARSQANLFHFRHVLVLLGVARAFVLLESEASEICNATNGWVGGSGDFDQIESRFFRAAQGVLDGEDAKLFALFVDNADVRDPDLAVGTRAGWDWRARVKWSTGYGQVPLLLLWAFIGHRWFGRGLGVVAASF
jgi:hypothetical protein